MPGLYFQIGPGRSINDNGITEELRNLGRHRQRCEYSLSWWVRKNSIIPPPGWVVGPSRAFRRLVKIWIPKVSHLAPLIAGSDRCVADECFVLNNERDLVRRQDS